MRRKKSPSLDTVAAHVEAWAKAWPHVSTYQQAAKAISREIGHLAPRQVTQLMVNALVAGLRRDYSITTAYHRRNVLRRILGHLHNFGTPKLQVPRLQSPVARETTATDAQIDALLKLAPPHMRLFILLCWQLALRFAEAQSVTPGCYNAQAHTITITRKGGKHRTIQTTPGVERLLATAQDTARSSN